ncbi:hypothetical protein AAZX31_11G220600 [Glycine max]|uniref:Nudix hydrolase domain-containing protein n=2 Tax=Glycine subgen. Soja TaxID=1462606 RepID=I1LMB6_SOYBN|nr:nudix hydrolase family protein [Glycine max]XP_028195678.1 nudix hydrolase 18, mitochondrial-like [Glycine soja]KAG4975100.1 hypothetical protein JHK87_031921 [Glycine soja]KAG4989670.1 hypothetical protein JHK85_032653 [Glycine max]KAG4995257.1 hypothetical protein JHK86_032084 [Glycine max]KAG5125251.1 hypothetical protein JHK82_031988 [Glycine max]KAG5146676.1 hypothetical protein JHK84_032219 [Glycine max]|eukprot:NP_001236875.2 nudix hydrolase family protein [Glycine max]
MVAVVSQENVAALVSRTGRELQRYRKGRRQVVGCIPYRFKIGEKTSLDVVSDELEVLVISSQKGKGMLFPKGGWELDESKKEAALRETMEEAGVRGIVGGKLGKWSFKSKTHDTFYEGYMFPLLVQEQLEFWPEQNVRQRIWMSVTEAREVCQHWWMKEALDRLVNRLSGQKQLGHYRDNKRVLGSMNCKGDAKSASVNSVASLEGRAQLF